MNIRMKFAKEGNMKYVGHLDMMRYFQKALRRADMDVGYTAGFNPHQILTFAAPLSVGITSTGEYLDMKVHSTPSSGEALERLNGVMAEGIRILEYLKLPDSSKNAMAVVGAAEYRIALDEDGNRVPGRNGSAVAGDRNAPEADKDSQAETFVSKLFDPEFIEGFYFREQIRIRKKSKRSEDWADIRPMIFSMKTEEGGLMLRLATGSAANLKPQLVLAALGEYVQEQLKEHCPVEGLTIHRMEIFDSSMCPLSEAGTVIKEGIGRE